MASLTTERVVVQLEHMQLVISCVRSAVPPGEPLKVVKVVPDLSDPTGARVLRQIDAEVLRCTSLALPKIDPNTVPVDIVMPGSLEGPRKIVRVSRLNIREGCNIEDHLGPRRAANYCLTNDVYASAIGQLEHLLPKNVTADWKIKTVLFVYIDEGVGSLILHKGRVIRGAGFGGPLGHAIVETAGQYFDDFRARGALEAYCSRPWLSANIVNRYFTDQDKRANNSDRQRTLSSTALRRALMTINLKEKESLSYRVLSDGVDNDDPIMIFALREAADYLGLAISHLLVTLNPHLVVLDGAMVHRLSGFFDLTLESLRRYTWVDAWNATTITRSVPCDAAAILGVICAAREGLSFHEA